LFVVGLLFILVVLLHYSMHYSTVISELAERNVRLAQDLALLEERLRSPGARDGRRPGSGGPRLARCLTKLKAKSQRFSLA
jgi:hypothetical protein